MKKLRVMNSTGDQVVEFDETQGMEEARALFERLTGEGAAVFALSPDRRVMNFDELASENVVVPRIVGG